MKRKKKISQYEAFRKHCGMKYQKRREEVGLPQIKVAKALGYSSPQFVSNWERGMCWPSAETLPKLAKALKMELTELVQDQITAYSIDIHERSRLTSHIRDLN